MTLQVYIIGLILTVVIVMFVFGMIDTNNKDHAIGISIICAFSWPILSVAVVFCFIVFLIFEVPFMIGRKLGNSE